MNSSSSSQLALALETLCTILESQNRQLTALIETIEKRKYEHEVLLELVNHYRLKEKQK